MACFNVQTNKDTSKSDQWFMPYCTCYRANFIQPHGKPGMKSPGTFQVLGTIKEFHIHMKISDSSAPFGMDKNRAKYDTLIFEYEDNDQIRKI